MKNQEKQQYEKPEILKHENLNKNTKGDPSSA